MTQVSNTAESGLADGTDVTTANSACPDGWTVVTPGAGGTLRFSATQKVGGSLSYAVTPASGVACYLQWSGISAANNQASFRGYVYFTGLPSTGQAILNFRSASASTSVISVQLNSTGTLSVVADTGASTGVLGTTAGTFSLNTWYRIEVGIDNASGGATGTVTVNTYVGESTTTVSNLSQAFTGLTIGTNTLGCVRVGRVAASGTLAVSYWDNLTYRTATNALPGPYVAPVNPTAAFTVQPQALTVALDGSSSTGNGGATITSYAWDFGDGNTGAGATISHTYSSANSYTITLTVTNSNGLTSSTSATFVAKTAGASGGFYSLTATSGWTNTGGAADLLTAVTDSDGTTYALSPSSPSSSVFEGFLDPLTAPAAGTTVTVRLTTDRINSTSGSWVAKLYEGATLRSTTSAVSVAAGSGTVTATIDLTIPSADQATVTAWAAGTLKLHLEGTAA